MDDGEVFDTSKDRDPLEFTVGSENIISGFQNAVIGMETGEKKTITVPPEEGYGPWNENLTMDVNKSELSPDMDPQVGQCLRIPREEGEDVIVTITDMDEESIKLDANHPLAGKTLTFDLELVSIA
jgi:FKBP-type peptidyl-prolyl cis-trans isomerase 2